MDKMQSIKFAKMSGAGNDFIVIDNRENQFGDSDATVIRKWCTRRLGIGADGLMLLNSSDQADFEMAYYNADGSKAAMCGNGGRCIARFAVLVGAVKPGQTINFTAPSGHYQAVVEGNQVDLKLIPPAEITQDIKLDLSNEQIMVDIVDTGVPHAVELVSQVDQINVVTKGREIRRHPRFQPHGVNANFAEVRDEHYLKLRTYERGVEDETLACGTGAAAAALIAAKRGLVKSPVKVETRSQVVLEMNFEFNQQSVEWLRQKGEARLIYWGTIDKEALEFKEVAV